MMSTEHLSDVEGGTAHFILSLLGMIQARVPMIY